MNQSIEKRLGHLIGHLRRKRLLAGDPEYKQENFIRSSGQFPFAGLAEGCAVCSLATLSRLENGRHCNHYALLDYFLNKLAIRYRIRESVFEREDQLLSRITSSLTLIPLNELKIMLDELADFYHEYREDPLLDLDAKALQAMTQILSQGKLERDDYDALAVLAPLWHPLLQQWWNGCATWLSLTHPDFWDLKPSKSVFFAHILHHHPFSQRIHAASLGQLVADRHSNLGHPSMIGSDHRIWLESELCLLSANALEIPVEGNSRLFEALQRFNGLNRPQAKLHLFETEIFFLLVDEPLSRPISKAVGRRIIELCQSTKTYKPLVNLVLLLSEKERHQTSLTFD